MLKKYFQDKTILLLLALSGVLALFSTLFVLLKIDYSKTAVITAYRPSLGQAGAFVQGSRFDLFMFAFVNILIMLAAGFLGYRLYQIKRSYALVLYGLTLVFLVFNLRVATALLAIR